MMGRTVSAARGCDVVPGGCRCFVQYSMARATVAHLDRPSRPGIVLWLLPDREKRRAGTGIILLAHGMRAGMVDLLLLGHCQPDALDLSWPAGAVPATHRQSLAGLALTGTDAAIDYGLSEALHLLAGGYFSE